MPVGNLAARDSFLTENLGTYDMFIQMARRLWCTIRIEEGMN